LPNNCGGNGWHVVAAVTRLSGCDGFDGHHRGASQWYVSFRWRVAETVEWVPEAVTVKL
jgi:hypothetical protein